MTAIQNVAAYKFVILDNLEQRQQQMEQDILDIGGVWGTILIAEEGVNMMLAGERDNLERVKTYLSTINELSDLTYKTTVSSNIPFNRFRVKIKNEIVPMGVEGVEPACFTGPTISPQQLKQWLDEDKDFVLLDTRNDYEIEIGTFEKAIHWNIHNFRDFAKAADECERAILEKPIVMFCTGGIRCEKASALLLQQKGFKQVYQLEGGILNYFQQVGGVHYRGACFIFDHRTAITPDCKETGLTQCERCQQFVTREQQRLTGYQRGDHCIHCMPAEQRSTLKLNEERCYGV